MSHFSQSLPGLDPRGGPLIDHSFGGCPVLQVHSLKSKSASAVWVFGLCAEGWELRRKGVCGSENVLSNTSFQPTRWWRCR